LQLAAALTISAFVVASVGAVADAILVFGSTAIVRYIALQNSKALFSILPTLLLVSQTLILCPNTAVCRAATTAHCQVRVLLAPPLVPFQTSVRQHLH
jgi:hypothetical protein